MAWKEQRTNSLLNHSPEDFNLMWLMMQNSLKESIKSIMKTDADLKFN